jgi:hypothetical protein
MKYISSLFKIFYFPSVVRPIFLKKIISNFKNDFPFFSFHNFLDGANEIFQIFSLLFSGMADSFQYENFHFKFQK